jgi:DNA-binding MarR family transcriptional regulator
MATQVIDGREITRMPPRVTYLVKWLELAIRAEMDVICSAFGVTAPQYTALSVLDRHPGMSSAQLARRSFVTAQSGNEMIGALERKGLISRTPDTQNRRILRITLTPKGNRLLARCDSEMDRLEMRMLKDVGSTRIKEFRQVLSTLREALTSDQ